MPASRSRRFKFGIAISPEWNTLADSDPDQGIETRRRMFRRLGGTPVLIIGTHFAGATAGRLVADGDGYRLDV